MTDSQTYYHGTKADLKVGDLIRPGYASNFGTRKQAIFVYLTATLDGAIWGAELAVGAGRGRIYIVEPTGSVEDDPNLTNRRFPGNPTKSYRCRNPLRIIACTCAGANCGAPESISSRAASGPTDTSSYFQTAVAATPTW